jgi:hypothetical protein
MQSKNSILFFILSLLFYFSWSPVWAESDSGGEGEQKQVERETETPSTSSVEYGASFIYSTLDLWVMPKWGGQFYRKVEDTSWQLEYLKGTLSYDFIIDDLGKLSEQKLILSRKGYWDSFYWMAGLYYSKLEATIGFELLTGISSSFTPVANLLTIETLGAVFGIGNQWNFGKRWFLGIDWIQGFIPLYNIDTDSDFFKYSTDSSDRETVDDVLKLVKYMPSMTFLKLSIGLRF